MPGPLSAHSFEVETTEWRVSHKPKENNCLPRGQSGDAAVGTHNWASGTLLPRPVSSLPPQASASCPGSGWGGVHGGPQPWPSCPILGSPWTLFALQATGSEDPADQHQSASQHQGPGGQRQEPAAEGAASSTPGSVPSGATTLRFGCPSPPSASWVSGRKGQGEQELGEAPCIHSPARRQDRNP